MRVLREGMCVFRCSVCDGMGGYTRVLRGRRREELSAFGCSAYEKQEVLNFLHQGCGCGRTGA